MGTPSLEEIMERLRAERERDKALARVTAERDAAREALARVTADPPTEPLAQRVAVALVAVVDLLAATTAHQPTAEALRAAIRLTGIRP